MNPLLYIAEIALYVVLFGGLPVLRKEGFSRQWVIEALVTGTVLDRGIHPTRRCSGTRPASQAD